MTAPTLTSQDINEPEPGRNAVPGPDLADVVYADWRTVTAAIDVLDLRSYRSWTYREVVELCQGERPDITADTVIGWVKRLADAGYVRRASSYDFNTWAVEANAWQTRAHIDAALRPHAHDVRPAAAPEATPPVPAPVPAEADADAGRLRARITAAEGNVRTADGKAAVLLAGLGFVAAPMLGLGGAAAVFVAAVLLVPAVLLGLVLLPRTQGLRQLAGVSSSDVIDAVAAADQPDRLASELGVLNGIALRKYALIRAALIAMTFLAPAYAAAALAF